MQNLRQLALWFILLAPGLVTGCAGLVKSAGETALYALETPTLEAAANRGAVATSLLRLNHLILNDLPISSDADWPGIMVNKLTDQQKTQINRVLARDPWYATRGVAGVLMLQQLGGLIPPDMSPLAYEAFKKIHAIYGDNPDNWPDIWSYSEGNFLEFNDKSKQPLEVEAATGNLYPNILAALIALLPINSQKSLQQAQNDLNSSQDKLNDLEQTKYELDAVLNANPGEPNFLQLQQDERDELKEQLEVLKVEIEQAKTQANEQQTITLALFDAAVVDLKAAVNLDPSQVALAQKVFDALTAVKQGSTHAISLYTLASTSLLTRGALQNFPTELQILLTSTAYIPSQADLMAARIERLIANSALLLPAIGMGTYHAGRQNSLANKYIKISKAVLEVYETAEKNATKVVKKDDEVWGEIVETDAEISDQLLEANSKLNSDQNSLEN